MLVSLLVYTILGIIFVKILEKLADYYPRLPYVIAGIGIAILAELFVERILFTIISASLAIVYFQFKIILGYIQKQKYFVVVLQNLEQSQIHKYVQYVWQCQEHCQN